MHQKQNLSKTEQSVAIWIFTILLVPPKILPKLGKINNFYRKTVQKVSEPVDVPVKNVKSRTIAKVSVLHRINQQAL